MLVVTAATGGLGTLVVEGLLARVPAAEIAVAVRDPARAAAFASRGVEVRQVDYEQPETLARAFGAGDKVLFISSSDIGPKRIAQHDAVIAAAQRASVALLAYTSILRGDRNSMILGADHALTERAIRASALPFVFLRNGWYLENYVERQLPGALAHGVLLGSAGRGRIAAAARADYADAAVAVLTGAARPGETLELAGDAAFTMDDFAAELARQSGQSVAYRDLPVDDYKSALRGAGLPPAFVDALADADVGIARGDLDDDSRTLGRLIGHPTTTLAQAIATALATTPRAA